MQSPKKPDNEGNGTNDKGSAEQSLAQEVYLQLVSNRSINNYVFGPSFNLDPPKFNIQSDQNEECLSYQDSDINDILFYIDEFENKYQNQESSIDTLNLHYDELINEIHKESTANGTRHKLIVYALKAKITSCEALHHLGRYQEALMELERCQKRFIINDPYLLNYINLKYSDLLVETMKFNKAMEVLHKCLLANESLGWKVVIADVLVRMGQIWALFKNFENSKILLLEAMNIYEKYCNKTDVRISVCYFQLGFMSFMKEDYFYCEKYTQVALDRLAQSKKHQILKIQCLNQLATSYQIQGIQESGVKQFNQALLLCQEGDFKMQEAHIQSNIGHLQRLGGNVTTSQSHFQKALNIYKKVLPSWNKKVKQLEQTQQGLTTNPLQSVSK